MRLGRYFLLSIGILSSCTGIEPSSGNNNQVSTEIENTVETWNILEDTLYETTVYKFTSSVPGKKSVIVGGIHGDEVAGWKAALQLKEKRNFTGEVLIIPQANIFACKRNERYPGKGAAVNGIKYKDLNRNFPGDPNGDETNQIAYAITQTVIDYQPDVIIDLHESLRSSSSSFFDEDQQSRLGDLLIYGNTKSSLFSLAVTQKYNASYLQDNDYPFGTDTYAPGGSFNQYFGKLYQNKIVLTIETTRYFSATKPKDEERRIQQQLELVDLVLEYSEKY